MNRRNDNMPSRWSRIILILSWGLLASSAWATLSCIEALRHIPTQWQFSFRPEVWDAIPSEKTWTAPDNVWTLNHDKRLSQTKMLHPTWVLESVLNSKSNTEARGDIIQRWTPETGNLELDAIALHLYKENSRQVPKWLRWPNFPDWKTGKGIPTALFLSLSQIKAAGIRPGSIKTLEIPTINNRRSIVEIYRDPDVMNWMAKNPNREIPKHLLEKAFLGTQSARHVLSYLWMSGHKLESVEVGYAIFMKSSSVFSEVIRANNTDIANLLPVPLPEEMLGEFSVNLILKPIF